MAFSAESIPATDTVQHNERRGSNNLFFGRFGMRAGYGIAIFLVCYVLLSTVAGLLAVASQGRFGELARDRAYAHAHPHEAKPALHVDFVPSFALVNDGAVFLGLLAMCWIFSRAERRPLQAYGLSWQRLADILPGAFAGVLLLSAVVAVLRLCHLLVFEGAALHGSTALLYGVAWLGAFLLVGLAEEYAFRGYLQYTLMRGVWGLAEMISVEHARRIAFWMAAGVLSFLFAAAHAGNDGETLFGLFQVFLAGITFAYALWWTGSLWWGIGFHMAWDWAQSFLFGVADSGHVSVGRLFLTHPQGRAILSGGSDGPEGSVFATVALLLTIATVRFTARRGSQPALYPEPAQTPAEQTGVLHSNVA